RNFGNFVRHWMMNWRKILIITLLIILVFSLQMIYWKFVTGKLFVNSYVGEGFFFLKPKLIKGLFGFRKGWYLYTPLMFLATFGFISLWRMSRQLFWSLVV